MRKGCFEALDQPIEEVVRVFLPTFVHGSLLICKLVEEFIEGCNGKDLSFLTTCDHIPPQSSFENHSQKRP